MDPDSSAPSDPKPLKHPQSHYWTTTKKGRIVESWVLAKDSAGKTVRKVELVDPTTGARQRRRVKRFDKMPAMVRIASGGARIEAPRAEDKVQEDADEDGDGVRKRKKWKHKCVVM